MVPAAVLSLDIRLFHWKQGKIVARKGVPCRHSDCKNSNHARIAAIMAPAPTKTPAALR
jgi:hypothetical protein